MNPESALRLHPSPLDPPRWATSTLTEDDGITHERHASMEAAIQHWTGLGLAQIHAITFLCTTDTVNETGWTRHNPTIVVEGGHYTLDGACRLRDALDELLRIADSDGVQRPQTA